MNYRKLFIAAVLLNIALGAAVYWISRSSQPAATEQAPVEHSPMEGFSTGTPPEGTAPPLTRIELTPERMQSIGVRTGHVEYKNIESDIRASGSVEVDERRLSYVQTRYAGWIKEVFASATYQLVNKGQHGRRHRLPAHTLALHPGDRLGDDRLNLHGRLGRPGEQYPEESLSCQWAAVMRAASFAELTTADTGGPPTAL